jgi:nickel/cobalt transporter (NicO) family protein
MSEALILLMITAASIGFFHTLTGPDHYVPFIVMAKARKWPVLKTVWITFVCGIGHVGSSVVIGLIGIATGIAVAKLKFIEGFRGNIAAWLFIAFGTVYFLWGLWKAYKNRPHRHFHVHGDSEVVLHKHPHEHAQAGEQHEHHHRVDKKVNLTPWVLFTVFVFGPCEPLIPLLMYPAAKESISGMLLVTATFSFFTIGTMLSIVLVSLSGLNFIPLHAMERYLHAIAGGTILLCGLAIAFLGL